LLHPFDTTRIIAGGTIYKLISQKQAEVTTYNSLYAAYERDVAYYNSSLRVAKGGISPQGYDFSYMNIFVPWEDNVSGLRYIAPTCPLEPYRPWDYADPSFSNTTPYSGYGQPTSYMYPLRAGSSVRKYWKNFGVMGISRTLSGSYRDGDLSTCIASYLTLTLMTKQKSYS
jgi:hypothetical protein